MLHLVDGLADEQALVEAVGDVQPLGQAGADALHLRLHPLGHAERIGGGLPQYAQADADLAVDAVFAARVLGRDLHLRHVAQQHMRPLRRAEADALRARDDKGAELLGPAHPRVGAHRQLARAGIQAAAGQLHILAPDGVLHVLHGQAARGQRLAVQPDAHGEAPLALDDDLGHAIHDRQPVHEAAPGDVGDLHAAVAVGTQRDPEDGPGVAIHLGHHRLVRRLGQPGQGAGHAVAHVVGRRVHVAVQLELDHHLRALVAALRGDGLDALDARHRAFDQLGDLGVHHRRAGADIGGRHLHHRRVDLRQLADRHGEEARHAQHDQQQGNDGGEDRSLDRKVGQAHDTGLPAPSVTRTGALSRRRCRPRVTTGSPAATPPRTSTSPGRRRPSWTSVRRARPSRMT